MKIYDLVIIGSGPAGMSAAIYAQRAMLDFVMIEKEYMPGGQVVQTYEVDNYPGIPKTNGMDLGLKFSEHAKELGAKSITAEVKEIYADEEIKEIMLKNGDTLKTRTIILATGEVHQTLGIEGEEKLKGMGVSYCATCDANFFEDFEVYVVGGGDSAVEEAMYLTKFARKVTIIHRRDELRAAKSIQEKAFKNPKLFFMWDSVVEELEGDDILQAMYVKNVKTGEVTKVEADPEDGMFGLFGFIGTVPNTKIFEGIIDMDERGYIKTDADMHTNIPGVYAAGDVRVKSLRQVVTAAADGAIAAVQVERSMSDYF